MTETQDGLEIIPDLSIISNYDVDLTSEYLEHFKEEDMEKFNIDNPEIAEAKRLRKEKVKK